MLPRARELFELVTTYGWDAAGGGGLVYLIDEHNQQHDKNKYYWALAEAIAAAGLLMVRCAADADAAVRAAAPSYHEWYGKMWRYAEAHFIDTERGGWYPMLNAENVRTDLHAAADHIGAVVLFWVT